MQSKLSNTEKALRSKKAKEALVSGLGKLVETGDLQKSIDQMFSAGKKSGALDEVKVGIILDLLDEIEHNWKASGSRKRVELAV